jgi:hypothetical protein
MDMHSLPRSTFVCRESTRRRRLSDNKGGPACLGATRLIASALPSTVSHPQLKVEAAVPPGAN